MATGHIGGCDLGFKPKRENHKLGSRIGRTRHLVAHDGTRMWPAQ